MALTMRPGNHPHIYWIDLQQNGILVECAVMKRDPFGNVSYIEVNKLDSIDKKRLLRIIHNRNAQSFELWDLMSQVPLNNGVNALQYFHQLVKVITPQGVITSPRKGEVGVGYVNAANAPREIQMPQGAVQQPPPAPPAAQAKTSTKRTSRAKTKAPVEEQVQEQPDQPAE